MGTSSSPHRWAKQSASGRSPAYVARIPLRSYTQRIMPSKRTRESGQATETGSQTNKHSRQRSVSSLHTVGQLPAISAIESYNAAFLSALSRHSSLNTSAVNAPSGSLLRFGSPIVDQSIANTLDSSSNRNHVTLASQLHTDQRVGPHETHLSLFKSEALRLSYAKCSSLLNRQSVFTSSTG